MNPVIRRRLPPSVRRLLTDIGPKEEEWTDAEPEALTRDGILLPSRGAADGQEEFLSPAKTQEEKAPEAGSNTGRSTVCMLCNCKPSYYTCPRCNLHYCGLSCYQSPEHTACSEEFYKESVFQELKEMGKTEEEGKKKMQEILLGLRRKAESTPGGMESLLKEVGVLENDPDEMEVGVTEKVQAMELLSRLAELSKSGDENFAETDAILRELEDIGRGEPLPADTGEDLESAEDQLELAERLSGLDIDQLSEEELWELLNNKEKEKFLVLVNDGALGGLVPLWKPWWEEHEEGSRALVEVLEEELVTLDRETSAVMNKPDNDHQVCTSQEEGQNQNKSAREVTNQKSKNRKKMSNNKGISGVDKVPPISAKIPKLSSLCANPSPLVSYELVSVLYGYAFSLCLLNGDTDSLVFDFCDMVLALSEVLNSRRVFSSLQEALDRGEALIQGGGYFDREDPLAPARAVEAVAHIMTGRDRRDAVGYCLAALSQLRSVLSKARKDLSKDGEDGVKRQQYFLASKKCEFFQAWALDNAAQIRKLSIELWSEHGRREIVRSSMEKAKTVVEENLKKEKKKGDSKLIEELG
ncbi:zinc finger HIT domain-containing protein 2 isoform 1-T2 [Menidia menidia]